MKNVKNKALLVALIALAASACSNSIRVRSYPTEAKVYIKDIITGDKREIGKTPLNITRTEAMGDVFFISLEKEEFLTRDILVKSVQDESLYINAKLEPKEEKTLAEQLGLQKDGGNGQKDKKAEDQKKKLEEQMKMLQEMTAKIGVLDNTIDTYKDALFSQRYIGTSRFSDRNNDKVIKLLFSAQRNVISKNYKIALKQIDKAIELDEYMAQAHVLKGSIYFINKNFVLARASWERALEIDPYNDEVLKYLQRLYGKIGISPKTALETAMQLRKSGNNSNTLRQPASVLKK
jgi:tetratricopeptide (TPR) repeat protein